MSKQRPVNVSIAFVLILATVMVFGRTVGFDFVNFDDPEHVVTNPHIQQGINLKTLHWAFTTGREGDFNPLTWISHMIDWSLHGDRAGGHHLTNVILHALNAVLLYLVFLRMTGARWRCALLALIFAIHPLRVESVAWVTERKDLLCATFWLLTMAAHIRYARKPNWRTYGLVGITFTAALLSKPMAVTLPIILLLLDYWPLHRFGTVRAAPDQSTSRSAPLMSWQRLVLEKLPLLAGSLCVTWLSYRATRNFDVIISWRDIGLGPLVGNALLSHWRYVQMLWVPIGLSPYYPHAGPAFPLWQGWVAGGGLVMLTAILWSQRRRRPYLWFGWLWYLIALAPVNGLVQAASQALADRYTYLPGIGLLVIFVWAGADWFGRTVLRTRYGLKVLIVLLASVALLLMFLTWRQTGYWRNSMTLWERSLRVTRPNALTYNSLAAALVDEPGRAAEAQSYAHEAIQLRPNFAAAYYNLGSAQLSQNNLDEAEISLRRCLTLAPNNAPARYNLAHCYRLRNQLEAAIDAYRETLQHDPEHIPAYRALTGLLASVGRVDDALAWYDRALAVAPHDATLYYNRGNALIAAGRIQAAVDSYRQSIARAPSADAWRNLGSALSLQNDLPGAMAAFDSSLRLDRTNPETHTNLGLVQNRLGRITESARHFTAATTLGPAPVAHYHLGRIEENNQRINEAVEHYRAARDEATAVGNEALVNAAKEKLSALHADP
ncbi:MAG: tetratricopeptide repeat protein [Verrucomicrobia bacterium]|nr:tetratricopeptide repeat protein [Verrucomicrobiota bacterium]